jgi:hypothetical protein
MCAFFCIKFWSQKISNPKHGFVLFDAKILYEKRAHKTLMKLTAELKAIHFHDLYPTYTLHDLVSHRAIIMLPYSIMSYKLTEFYALSIPLFVPSPKFYRNNNGLQGVNFINILCAAFASINLLTTIKRKTNNNTTKA